MSLKRTSEPSLIDLRRLRQATRDRGDETLSVLLGGIEVYVTLGRELELLELMKKFADDIKDTVDATPSAADLKRMYNADPAGPPVE